VNGLAFGRFHSVLHRGDEAIEGDNRRRQLSKSVKQGIEPKKRMF
jgi:hypothetical protein